MAHFIINGGKKLTGTISTNSAKNSAVAILCATVMINGKTTLSNVPVIEEVKRIIEILTSIGLKITWTADHQLEIINDNKINLRDLNTGSFCKTRSALLLMGALCGRLENFSLPQPGGCKLGIRTVNPYLIAFEHLNIEVKESETEYKINSKHKKAGNFTMYESGDTATENTIMAAILTPGLSEINFASSNYMVQDLCHFLVAAGAKIEGIGTKKLTINGVEELKPVTNYPIMPDPIEAMAFISIAITTKSQFTITHCPLDFLSLELEKLRVMGQKFKLSPVYKSANGYFDLVDIELFPSELKALPDKIHPQPYPGLNIDNLPIFIPILTQANGSTLVHDWVYEDRLIYAIELKRMGANITLYDPHRILVTGPTELQPAEIICPPALRPSINLLICMLAANGKSTLRNSYPIDRGYENIAERLKTLGADIERVE
ncbi:MAG: UDP-N-acetylglucosamine 1-carboxyvinyltransferase [Candidatus Parcubacteria bacterium]|nr:UDP-N-acetylglucosamine 1-carboxyvinyltransferase [Candidatus Parcubacteria bacterium]